MHIAHGSAPTTLHRTPAPPRRLARNSTDEFMTLEEIAQLAGVSRSTVSRVVNGDARVSAAVRTRVQQVIEANNFHPNAAARSLASRRTRIIGLLIPHVVGQIFRDPFFPILVQGAVEACTDADHLLTMLME